MPGFGQADYTLVRPIQSAMDRRADAVRIGAMQDQRAMNQMNMQNMQRQWQQVDSAYQQKQQMLSDIKGFVQKNTLEDGTLNEDGFIKDVYGVNPELATQIQAAVGKKRGGIGAAALEMKKQELDKKISGLPDGEEKQWYSDNYYELLTTPSAVVQYSPKGLKGAKDKAGMTTEGRLSKENEMAGTSAETEKIISSAKASGSAQGKAAGESAAISSGNNPQAYSIVDDLRTRFENIPEMKDLKVINANYKKATDVMAAYKSGKAKPYEIDQSLAFFANKALDPNSVVMPGEFERFAKGLGYKSLQAMVDAFASGGLKLNDENREAMYNIVQRSYNSAIDLARPQYEMYRGLATKRSVSPEDVTGGYDYLFKGNVGSQADDKSQQMRSKYNY